MSAKKPWTPRHVNEAKAALYRLAAEAILKGDLAGADSFMRLAADEQITTSEGTFQLGLIVCSLSAEAVEREMRWVRARAEGRVVETVETQWLVRGNRGASSSFGTDDDAESRARTFAKLRAGRRVVRVNITRRRIRRAEEG